MAMMMEVGMNIMKMQLAFNTNNDRIRLIQKCARAIKMCCEKFKVSNFPLATCGYLITSMIKSGIIEGVSYSLPTLLRLTTTQNYDPRGKGKGTL